MSAAVHTAVRAGIKRIHFIAPTTTDFHDIPTSPEWLPEHGKSFNQASGVRNVSFMRQAPKNETAAAAMIR